MPITIDTTTITLRNSWLSRRLSLADGTAYTSEFLLRPYGEWGGDSWIPFVWPGTRWPVEAAVFVGGREHWFGPQRDPAVKEVPYDTPSFQLESHTVARTKLGERLTLRLRPARPDVPPLELLVHYEIADDLPLLIKSLEVINIGEAPVVIDNVTVDMFIYERLDKELRVFTDYYDAYGKSRRKDTAFAGWVRREFPQPIGLPLPPGERFESFRVFEYATPDDADEAALVKQRIFHVLAPWITRQSITQEVDGVKTFEDLLRLADNAAALGIECVNLFIGQLFTNTGDYRPRPDLFPNGAEDLKRLVAHFHARGVKVVPYCALTIAWQRSLCGDNAARVCDDHDDWQYLGPEGVRFNCWGWGNMCYQSAWGDYITGKLNWLTRDLGFDGLFIDGPYHGLPCLATNHKHTTAASVPFMNWDFERKLYAQWRERGLYFTVPQDPAAILFGANARPGGYTETDYAAIGGMPLVVATRARLYDARHDLPGNCAWGYHVLDPLHGHGIEPSEDDPRSFEHALAGTFGYGHWGLLRGRKQFVGPKTEAIFRKWIGFYRQYRETLGRGFIHLVRPDGRHPDAVLHVNPAADPPAIVVAFNPARELATLHLCLPLRHAGFAAGATARAEGIGDLPLDSGGRGQLSITLAGGEVRAVVIGTV